MSEPTFAYVGLGANLGPRRQTIEHALEALDQDPDLEVRRVSTLRETEAVGGPAGQPPYLNGVAELGVRCDDPHDLLARLLAVESALGRRRDVRWGPRMIDLDLLVCGDRVVSTETLVLPHPRLRERMFVLEPLCELAPALWVPGAGAISAARACDLLAAIRARATMRP